MRLPLGKTLLLKIKNALLCRETLWAVLLVLLALSIAVMTADTAPTWIYQGF